jgi:hypothetical protein
MLGPMSGHLFIVQGDLTQLYCDHWALPCDERLFVSRSWRGTPLWKRAELRRRLRLTKRQLPGAWGPDGLRAIPMLDWAGPARPWLTNVGFGPEGDVGWFVEGARQFVREAAKMGGALERARPLLALPIVGTGYGGARWAAGELLRPLLAMLLEQVAVLEVDVALVAFEPADFAAAQAARREALADRDDPWRRCLGEALCARADETAAAAVRGQLVVFMGAGVSAGAGLPTWVELLRELASRAGLNESERQGIERLGHLDRAQVIDRRMGSGVGEAVASSLLEHHHCALSQGLLAGLPVTEFITTNYDDLFERASESVGRPVAVLPYAPTARRSRWLLKMHGCVNRHHDIVLTREHYLRYGSRNAALEGIVQAMLITRHMLYVGFSLSDDNFHRIVDAVRRAIGAEGRELGTVVALARDDLVEQLWGDDLSWVHLTDHGPGMDAAAWLEAQRRFEIWLDRVSAAAVSTRHLLEPRFEGVLTGQERLLAAELQRLRSLVDEHSADPSPAWAVLSEALERLGSGS